MGVVARESRKTTSMIPFYPLLYGVSKIGRDLLDLWFVGFLSIIKSFSLADIFAR